MSDRSGKPSGEGRTVTLTVPSDPEHLRLVRALVGASAEAVGFKRPEINQVCLAVDEACTNIIRHAYGGDRAKVIEVRLGLCADRLDVTLRDRGRKAKPGEIKPRDLDDIRPGGLGVHFMREIMDEVVYDTSVDVGTELRMTKSLPARPADNIGK